MSRDSFLRRHPPASSQPFICLQSGTDESRLPLRVPAAFNRRARQHRSHLDRRSHADEHLAGERAGLIRATESLRRGERQAFSIVTSVPIGV
jgi:hypothetical protein